jgi:hypothetical protein
MANKINIKVNRLTACRELQTKLDVLKAKIAEDDAKQAVHEKAIQEWNTIVMNSIVSGNYEIPTDRGLPIEPYGSDTYRLYLNIKDIKPRPEFRSEIHWREREMVKELERTIRLLGMSVDENVSTKIFDSLGDLL